jgi:hypothetical protein
MSADILAVEAQRARWRRQREGLCLVPSAGDRFALGGLGQHVDNLDVRIVILPADPDADAVRLDGASHEWMKADRPSPYGGRHVRWGSRDRATSDGLVRYDKFRDDGGWDRYLALRRHGGLEVAFGNVAHRRDDLAVFPLREIVGLAWALLEMQLEVKRQWSLALPSELSVALRNTARATLGGLAEGWPEPHMAIWRGDVPTSIEERVLLRWELERIEPEVIAIDVGERVEQAFGSIHRRHLANRGEYEGKFDPRFEI